jgi:NADH:ubiquinone oxidoreductase subunit 6 (subunit J)
MKEFIIQFFFFLILSFKSIFFVGLEVSLYVMAWYVFLIDFIRNTLNVTILTNDKDLIYFFFINRNFLEYLNKFKVSLLIDFFANNTTNTHDYYEIDVLNENYSNIFIILSDYIFLLFQVIIFLCVCISIYLSICLVLKKMDPILNLLGLIGFFISMTFLFLYFNYDFFALILLVIYIGSIVVLFLFVIMLLNIRVDYFAYKFEKYRVSSAFYLNQKGDLFVYFILLFCLILSCFLFLSIYFFNLDNIDELKVNFLFINKNYFKHLYLTFLLTSVMEYIYKLGIIFYVVFFVPFIILTLILLLALISAVVLTIKKKFFVIKSLKQKNINILKNKKNK